MPRRSALFGPSCLALALGLLAWVAPGTACAQSEPPPAPSLQIHWSGPEDCERGEAVRAKVLRLLGASPRALEPFEVSVRVQREGPARYVAELETTTASGAGAKRLEGESCDAIALASSVVIALSIDPEASLDASEPAPVEPPPAAPRARPKPAPPQPVQREPRHTAPFLFGSVGVLFGLLDDPSAFASAGVGVRHHLVSFELGGAVYQGRDVFRADRPKVGAELRLYSADLLGCYGPLRNELGALGVCLGGRLERLNARAFGVSNPDEGTVLVLAGLAALRGRLRATSWLSATLDAGISLQPFHPTFVLLGVGDVFDIPVVSPFARTGLQLEF